MKKKLLIISMFAMLLCLSACQKEVVLPDSFKIEDYAAELSVVKDAIGADNQSLEIFAYDAGDYINPAQLGFDIETYKALCAGTLTAREEAGNPVSMSGEVLYEVSGIDQDVVTASIPVEFEKHTVYYEITFEPNPKAGYNPYVKPYSLTQIVVSTQYPMSELMKMAGMNTLMGMGVVFLVLIFISFVISLFKYLPGNRKKQKAEKEETPKAPVAAPVTVPAASENLVNDQELVAVITAAILAAQGSVSNIVSSDKLIVRSIKRVSR